MTQELGYAQILIVEFGSQYTLKIESTLRELGYRSAVLNPKRAEEWLKRHPVKGIILSGGFSSVYDEGAPKPPSNTFEMGVPVLAICYGMQWIAKEFGGEVRAGSPEYGSAHINHKGHSALFKDIPHHNQRVWMSHGDSIYSVPEDFSVTATSFDGFAIAAIEGHIRAPVYGVQFHPEVENTAYGKTLLKNFANICNCEQDWSPTSVITAVQEDVLSQLAQHEEVVGGFSGGVDSSVLSAILAPALGKQFHPITIDGGQFRENEMDEVRFHAKAVGINLIEVEASAQFYAALAGITDAQKKRKAFQPTYSRIFQDTALRIGPNVGAFLQGTLAPDEIESGATGGAVIKTHHNVGLDTGRLRQLHPLRKFFKYEIRALARELGLPESISERQPFPGPGLFIRRIGDALTPARVEVVRWIDARTKEILVHHNVYKELSQMIAAYGALPTVGVKGDGRVYTGLAMIRGVQTIDFMTAEGYAFEPALQKEISRVLGKHPEIVHTGFFPTDKPPATTEFE